MKFKKTGINAVIALLITAVMSLVPMMEVFAYTETGDRDFDEDFEYSYSFSENGDYYYRSTYLIRKNSIGPGQMLARSLKASTPSLGRLSFEITAGEKVVLEAQILDSNGRVCGDASGLYSDNGSLSTSYTTDLLPKGSYTIDIGYEIDTADLPPQYMIDPQYDAAGTHSITYKISFLEATAEEKQAIENENQTEAYNSKVAKAKAVKVKNVKVAALKGRKANITWNKAASVSGYQLQYCMKKSFKSGVKKKNINSAKTVKTTVKSLKAGKTWYFRIRSYTKIKNPAGKTVTAYGKWSAVRKCKAKK